MINKKVFPYIRQSITRLCTFATIAMLHVTAITDNTHVLPPNLKGLAWSCIWYFHLIVSTKWPCNGWWILAVGGGSGSQSFCSFEPCLNLGGGGGGGWGDCSRSSISIYPFNDNYLNLWAINHHHHQLPTCVFFSDQAFDQQKSFPCPQIRWYLYHRLPFAQYFQRYLAQAQWSHPKVLFHQHRHCY